MKIVTAKLRMARELWIKKLDKLHGWLRGRGIAIPAEQQLREDRNR